MAEDQAALLALIGQLTSSPAMQKMAELKTLAQKHGLDEAEVDKLVPTLCKFIVHHAAKEKLHAAAEFAASVILAAADFPKDVAGILESLGGQ